mmetsp:Transcript_107733/g.285530  ORF Transcript_107733/g.285530 Transcript_107733/m.285530 type:complete len:278 (+) Transcript_107733:438-1271(+)
MTSVLCFKTRLNSWRSVSAASCTSTTSTETTTTTTGACPSITRWSHLRERPAIEASSCSRHFGDGSVPASICTDGPDMVFTNLASMMLFVVVLVKIAVWRVAKNEYDKNNNVSLEALALDNFNDILSNASALLFASLTRLDSKLWWMDPVGGILISIYIIRSWCMTAWEQINMLVGKEAHPEFLTTVREMAEHHHPEATLDVVRAYHFGPKFLVEVELCMDRDTPLWKSHDVGIVLQDKIEQLEECERCFVHIDYQHRDHDDHDRSVPIHHKVVTPT